MSNVLEVAHLSVRFGKHRILDDLTFSVPEGSTLAVIGPNGSGKTVLFKALIGAVRHKGEVRWSSTARIGYVPQKLDLERDLPITGLDFLRAKAAVAGVPGPAEIRRVMGAVSLTPEVVAQPIGALAGGHFQRLLLAFALLGHPSVLLFDEPTAGMDEPVETGTYAAIRQLQQEEGLTLLLISHELNVVYQYATHVLCLGRRRACYGPPLEILTPEQLQEAYGAPVRFHIHDADDDR